MSSAVGANPFGYSAAVWQRFQCTPGAGELSAAEGARIAVGRARSRAADLELELSLRLDGPRIVEARFRAHGCPTTIAVGQWLSEVLPGRSLDEIARLRAADIVAALEIGDDRLHCALLGEDVIAAVVEDTRT